MSMSSSQKVIVGCGIAVLAAVGCVVLMIGGCVGLLVKGAKDYPVWASGAVINPANEDVTERIDKIITDSSFMSDAQKKIAAESWPPKVLLIAFKEGTPNPSQTEVFTRDPGMSSNVNFTMNGNGYGSVTTSAGKKDVAIIERHQTMKGGTALDYVLYIEASAGQWIALMTLAGRITPAWQLAA